MKKLFFTALVAVVAVGGAYANTYYAIGSNQPIDCPAGVITCNAKTGSDFLVSSTPAPGDQSSQRLLSTIPYNGL